MLILQGTKDPLVPYRGGSVAFGRGKFIDTEAAARRWAGQNGAAHEPIGEPLPAADGTDGCGGARLRYSRWA